MLLLSAVYSGEEKKVYLKFYDPKDNVVYHWRDRTGHKPYCYTKMEFAEQAEQVAQKETKYTLERVKKRDIIADKEIDVLKVLAPDPLSIGGTDYSFREKVTSWECYDIATEILTKEGGWKSYYQLRDDEVVATYNATTRKFEWQQIEAKVDYDYSGDMYGLHAKTIDFLVTPNHRIFLWNETGDVKCMLAKELYEQQEQLRPNYRPFPFGWSIHKSAESGFDGHADIDRFTLPQSSWRCSEVDIPLEEFVEFLGWFIAEGGIGGRGNETYINLTLSTDKDPWQHLKHMIESWGMRVWTRNNNDTHSTMMMIIFSSKDLADWIRANCYTGSIHRSHYKRVPAAIKNLPTRYLKIFLKNLFLGDGFLRDGDSGQLRTTSEALADDIQEIACKCGYSAIIKQKPAIVDNRGWQFAESYVVTLSTHRTVTSPNQRITKQQYVGKVWCVKVPNGIVYVRRNKKPYWCGNSDIKYHENYLYDRSLIPGLYYVRKGEQISLFEYPISEKVQFALKSLLWDKIKEAGESGKEYRQYITNWANLLNQPIPELKRVAVDIEVETEEGRMPNPRDHDKRVTAVGFVASDGFRKVLVLANNTPNNGEPLIPEAEPCNTEKELLEKAFRIINEYPIVITFNGDDFDLPYLYARSQDSRIDPKGVAIPKDKVPIMVKKESFVKHGMQAEPVGIRHGIHIDLYRTFDNRSIQIYAFSRAYTEHTLNAICEALLNDSKIEFEGDIADLPIQKLAEYCLKDADLTYRLTSFNDNLLMRLLVVISRIGRLSVDDIARFGVNQWIRGILYYEHRQRNELIPSRSELEAKGSASTTAVIKEKKYRGGEVVEPTAGIHFNVVVLDFASLYPSIIKVHNLSYETINCPHDDCRENKVEGTTHWVCKRKKGLTSLLIGSLRDLRVNYYKYLAKDKTLPPQERQLYNVVSQAIKVILNACFTADTNVLTPDGLRKITDLKVGDKVYTLNERTHKVEIKPVVEVQHYVYNDQLVQIKTKDVDWQVTGNHKLYLGKRKWGENGTTKIEFAKIDASDAANAAGKRFLFRHEKIIDDNAKLDWCNLWKYAPDEQNTIIIKPNKRYDRRFADSPRFAHYEFASKLKRSRMGRHYLASKSFIDSLSIGPQEFEDKYDCKIFVKNFPARPSSYTRWSFKASAIFELIGWYVTEGHARIGKSRRGYNFTRIAITQHSKHAANVSKIASMIQELGIKPEKQTDRILSFSSHIIANFLISECGSGSRNKHLPSFVFSAPIELRKILFETMMCGDGYIKRGVYSSVSRKLVDDFRHLAFTLGIETSVSKETLKSGSVIFRVKLFKRKHHIVKPKDFTLRPVKNLNVYCITAQDNHVIYAGREGKLGWIGQSYGVMGAEIFPLYCLPVADATAALGRSTINRTINKCKEIGIEVVYGDTDSLFLKNPSPTAIDEVAAWARNTLGVDLEIDKQYRYVVFSDLKKNYLGVLSDGTVDVKGLTGKKSHTPPFIRKAFYDILAILGRVNSEKDFESARESIKNVILQNAKNLEARKIPLEDLSFNVTINKSLSTYGKKTGAKTVDGKSTDTYKGLPQHIKAAKMLVDANKREIRAGDVISYVKIKNGEGVKPVELAKPEEIDTEKYLETMESTFEQVLSALNFDFKSVLGKPRQQSLDELFWSKS